MIHGQGRGGRSGRHGRGRDLRGEPGSLRPGGSKADARWEAAAVFCNLNPKALQAETVYLPWQNTSSVYQLGDLSETTDPKITIK